MAKNDNLHKAKDAKNDEFYTRIEDVAEELRHYKKHFAGKVVFCNCDDPTWSAFLFFLRAFFALPKMYLIREHIAFIVVSNTTSWYNASIETSKTFRIIEDISEACL